jgi:hypothetical protein
MSKPRATGALRTLARKSGGQVALVTCDSEHVTLECDFSSPPGSSVELVVAGAPISVKVRACRRLDAQDPPRFGIEGRWVNLSRVQRESLLG